MNDTGALMSRRDGLDGLLQARRVPADAVPNPPCWTFQNVPRGTGHVRHDAAVCAGGGGDAGDEQSGASAFATSEAPLGRAFGTDGWTDCSIATSSFTARQGVARALRVPADGGVSKRNPGRPLRSAPSECLGARADRPREGLRAGLGRLYGAGPLDGVLRRCTSTRPSLRPPWLRRRSYTRLQDVSAVPLACSCAGLAQREPRRPGAARTVARRPRAACRPTGMMGASGRLTP